VTDITATAKLYKNITFGSQDKYWQTPVAERKEAVPIMLDCMFGGGTPMSDDGPAPLEDVHDEIPGGCNMAHFCINRHNGSVNGLFMDWSTRPVDLKELWTLKWHRTFDTSGKWTRAGGARPKDWPQWMQHFKDY